MIPQKVARGRLQAAEAEIIVGLRQHRPGKIVRPRIPLLGQAIEGRTPGVGQADQFGDFVEAFPGRVIDCGAEQMMSQLGLEVDQQGVPAADDERNVWLKRFEVRARRVAGNPRRVQVRFVMVNADKRFAQSERDGLGSFETDHQRAGQPGPARRGGGIHFRRRNLCCAQRRLRDRNQVAQMLARSQLGDNAAVGGMEIDLGGDRVGQHSPVSNHRGAGFIAGSFEGQNSHARALSARVAVRPAPEPRRSRSLRGGNFFTLPAGGAFSGGGAFGVEGNSFEHVNGALELGIMHVDDLFPLLFGKGLQSARAAPQHQRLLFLGRRGHDDVRGDPLFMDHFVARRVILGRRQTKGRAVL